MGAVVAQPFWLCALGFLRTQAPNPVHEMDSAALQMHGPKNLGLTGWKPVLLVCVELHQAV
jgi:hypothetical protein